jgi:BolA family transcriptional regulator, general stress-responsive regulator
LTANKTHLSRAERIENAVRSTLAPIHFVLTDESAKHSGHAGARPGGESHYHVVIVASVFEGLTRVARQRLVYQALDEEFETGLHALSLNLKTPGEAGSA